MIERMLKIELLTIATALDVTAYIQVLSPFYCSVENKCPSPSPLRGLFIPTTNNQAMSPILQIVLKGQICNKADNYRSETRYKHIKKKVEKERRF